MRGTHQANMRTVGNIQPTSYSTPADSAAAAADVDAALYSLAIPASSIGKVKYKYLIPHKCQLF